MTEHRDVVSEFGVQFFVHEIHQKHEIFISLCVSARRVNDALHQTPKNGIIVK